MTGINEPGYIFLREHPLPPGLVSADTPGWARGHISSHWSHEEHHDISPSERTDTGDEDSLVESGLQH